MRSSFGDRARARHAEDVQRAAASRSALKVSDSISAKMIFRRRMSLGMSQKALAELVGVSAGAVCRWESGQGPGSEAMAEKISAVLMSAERKTKAANARKREQE